MAPHSPDTPNRLGPPSVVGLEGGRQLAERRHRRKRLKERFTSSVLIALLMGLIAAAGYIGYHMYEEQQAADAAERERRVAEIEAERSGRTTDDLIDQLTETPRWNGPGSPAFGVGDDPEAIDITDGRLTDD